MIFAGRSILCFNKLSSINGDDALLSIITNKANDPTDNNANDTTIICVEFTLTLLLLLLLLPFPIYVRVSKKEAIVTAKVIAPFTSRFCLPLLLLAPSPPGLGGWPVLDSVLASACVKFPSFSSTPSVLLLSPSMNLLITIQRLMATGTIKRNVACQPKLWIILPPTANPTTEPAANIELNTPTPIASFSFGNWSLIIPKAIGNMDIPIPWITLATSRKDMFVENPPAEIPMI